MDIALIGMAGIYPGADCIDRLWNNILDGVESVTDAPACWHPERYHDPQADGSDNTHSYCKRGGFIDAFAEFNPLDFGIMPNSVDGSDPEHFLALRVARDALADAGCLDREFARDRTAVIMGRGFSPNRGFVSGGIHAVYLDMVFDAIREIAPGVSEDKLQAVQQHLKEQLPPFTPETCPGIISNLMTGRIANRFNLMGPNYLVDAACASGLVALDAGIRELQSGRCDMALVGGAQANTNAYVFIVFSMLGALSRRGHLRPFDRHADGTLLGEGIGMGVIKRLADAERDGDRIYAVIKGVGLASDGHGQAFLVPRLEGEVTAMRRAYEVTGLAPETVDLLEAHGTATPVGDRTEIQAIRAVFGGRDGKLPRCALGSVKSMLSHTIPASAMAGLFKTALALYEKVLPPTLCDEPNPELGIEQTPMYVNTAARPWIHGKPHPRRAAISAFGFGGINTHAVVEEYRSSAGEPASGAGCGTLQRRWPTELVVLQGGSRAELAARALELRSRLASCPEPALRDVAFTLNRELSDGSMRLAVVASDVPDLVRKLELAQSALQDPERESSAGRNDIYFTAAPAAGKGRLAFLLPGEGAQYRGMLADLCRAFPEVRVWFDQTDRLFAAGDGPRPGQVVFPPTHMTPEEDRRVEQALWSMAYAVPLVVTADAALLNLFLRLGIRPDAMAGHSTAQNLALGAAAYLDMLSEDAMAVTGLLDDHMLDEAVLEQVPEAHLLSVGACDAERVRALVDASCGALSVAMDNCPNQIVLCGDPDAIESVRGTLAAEGAICQLLPFDRAYHTDRYRTVCEMLEHTTAPDAYAGLQPTIPVYSTTTGGLFPEDPAAIRRIMIDQWAEPIRFRETIEAMYADGIRLFVETGPRGNLTAFVEDTLCGREHVCVAADTAQRDGLTQLHHALAQLTIHGVTWRPGPLYSRRGARPIDFSGETATKPRKASTALKLDFDIPRAELGSETAAKLRHCIQAAWGTAPAADGTEGASGRAGASDNDKRLQVMQAYLQSMEQFLDTHEAVMADLMAYPAQKHPEGGRPE